MTISAVSRLCVTVVQRTHDGGEFFFGCCARASRRRKGRARAPSHSP